MPLFRALVVDGATYYLIFIIAFGVQIVANTSNEVGRLHFIESNRHLLVDIALLFDSGYQVCGNASWSHHALTAPTVSHYSCT